MGGGGDGKGPAHANNEDNGCENAVEEALRLAPNICDRDIFPNFFEARISD